MAELGDDDNIVVVVAAVARLHFLIEMNAHGALLCGCREIFRSSFISSWKNFNQLNVIIFGRDICERAAAAGADAASAVVCVHM